MDASEHARTAAVRQTELYGESWSDRLNRLLTGFGLSQAKLAAVVGLSAPMLSQLISGHRLKIGNPAVYGRIVSLEEELADPAFGTRSPAELADLLTRTANSHPVLSTRVAVADPDGQGTTGQVIDHLGRLAGPRALRTAARAVAQEAPALAEILDRAARRAELPPR